MIRHNVDTASIINNNGNNLKIAGYNSMGTFEELNRYLNLEKKLQIQWIWMKMQY